MRAQSILPFLYLGIVTTSIPILADTNTPTNRLLLKPNRCVALHQGQACYQWLNIRWQLETPGHYCLQWQDQAEPLHCFELPNEDQAEGQIKYEFIGTSSKNLQLFNRATGELVTEEKLEVAWVYKANSRRKTHWRIF